MIEEKVSNLYKIFKLKEDGLNWTYVAEGPVIRHKKIHCPRMFRGRGEMQHFTDDLINNHMEYLKEKDCHPQNSHCSHISFSYKVPYETSIVYDNIWHTEEFSKEEIRQFEKGIFDSHRKYWNNLQTQKTV